MMGEAAVANAALRSLRFREEREETWKRLEQLVARFERGAAHSLSLEDMVAMPGLYRATLSSLSVARETSLDAALIEYLEALSTRAYFCVYGARTTLFQRIGGFFTHDWPRAVRRLWRETLAAAFIFWGGTALGFALVGLDPTWFYSIMPETMAQGRDPSASAETLRQSLYAKGSLKDGLEVFATFLFTNNAQVSLFAFALGIAFCLPSALLIAQQGMMLGALFSVFSSKGLAVGLGGWIFVHGATELFAIILAGAAGFHVGLAIAFPGSETRLGAAERAGREGGVVMIGVVIMLVVAGLLEGFVRQLVVIDWLRYAIAITTLSLWLSYFYLPQRRRHG
jgi:uncharacterized membrane protein SpoIIM required for sporulation